MANTEVSICNLALTMLSSSRITSLTQNDENARKCNAIYETTRNTLLSEHNWNFARTETSLALLSDTPTIGDWAYEYQLPVDCLRVIRMEDDEEFAVFGNRLYTNADSVVIEYIAQVTDTAKFSAGFVRALAARLAADLAFGITQNATLAQGMEAKAHQALQEAKWSDAQEGIGNTVISGSFIDERAK